MSGHNKWSKIKHKKASVDAQKSKAFGKLTKLITVESKKTGGDINSPELRGAIEKAKQVNMPTDNINRAVQKGKTNSASSLEEVLYEVYGPGGVAMIILGLTDNKNRTAAEIKHLLVKQDLSLAEPGAAMWAFEKEGNEYKPKTTTSISKEESLKLKTTVEIILEHDDIQDVFTNELLND